MREIKVEVSRLLEQMSAPSLRSNPLEDGSEVRILDVQKRDIPIGEGPTASVLKSDTLICTVTHDGSVVKRSIPMREYLRLQPQNSGELYNREGDSGNAVLVGGFKVIGHTKRVTSDNKPAYPASAYKKVDAFYKNEISYNELVEGGLKDEDADGLPNGIPQLRDYSVEILQG